MGSIICSVQVLTILKAISFITHAVCGQRCMGIKTQVASLIDHNTTLGCRTINWMRDSLMRYHNSTVKEGSPKPYPIPDAPKMASEAEATRCHETAVLWKESDFGIKYQQLQASMVRTWGTSTSTQGCTYMDRHCTYMYIEAHLLLHRVAHLYSIAYCTSIYAHIFLSYNTGICAQHRFHGYADVILLKTVQHPGLC